MVMLTGCVVFTYMTYKFLIRNFALLRDFKVLELWSSLYGMMTTQRPISTMYIIFYCIRRFTFAATCVLLTNYPLFQIHLIFLQSLLMLSYLLYYWPFLHTLLNYLEVFNETCIMLCMYPALSVFTGALDSTKIHYNTGWVVIGIIAFNVAVNLMVELWQIALGLYRLWLRFYYKLTG